MVSVETVKDEIRVSIPTNGMSQDAVSSLVGWLRAEVVARQSSLTEEKAWQLAEDVKSDWWKQNQARYTEKKA